MIEALVADTLGLLKVPLAGSLASGVGAVAKTIVSKKMEEKRHVLIEELKAGNLPIDKLADDEFVSAVWRTHMAIVQGAGVFNIKLLARVLIGLETSSTPVYADSFLRYATILESLTYEEIRILGLYSKELLKIYPLDQLNEEKVDFSKLHSVAPNVLKEYVGSGGNGYDFYGYCASLMRTGLLIPVPVLGGVTYNPSPLLAQLVKVLQNNIDCVLH